MKPDALRIAQTASRLLARRIPLPEMKVGKYAVKHSRRDAGTCLDVISLRDAIFSGGGPPTKLTLANDITIHELTGPEGTWMTDLPCELFQMKTQLADNARGHVLVGGLGLGLLPRMLTAKRSVKSVTVVERQPEVITMVWPSVLDIAAPVRLSMFGIVEADIYRFADSVRLGQFDCALLDTWQATGEFAWITEVVPLRRKLAQKIPRIFCWQEETMISQIAQALWSRADADPAALLGFHGTVAYYAFRRGLAELDVRPKRGGITGPDDLTKMTPASFAEAEIRNRQDPVIQRYVSLFLRTVGSELWEHYFGRFWDEALGAAAEKSKKRRKRA